MNEIEAVGELAQGGLIARAVEPVAGDDAGHTHESACLNCGTPLVGSHCHACGQRGHVHRTLGAFFHDLVHGVLHFEGKVWHTLPLLALRPGELTRRYVAGERARFVSPMALFLFAVFLMFAVFQMVGISAPEDLGPPPVAEAGGRSLEGQLAGLRAGREGMTDDNPAAPILDSQIAAIERRLEAPGDPDGEAAPVIRPADQSAAITQLDGAIGSWVEHAIEKWSRNPELMAYKLQANFYKFSWLLIPLSVPFMWLLFAWRRRFGAYDHAVFVTYSLCFMSLLFVAIALLGQVPWVSGGLLFFAAVLIPPAHIYKQLRGAYGLSRVSAGWRTMVLLVFITVVLGLFVNLLLLLGAMA